MKNRVPFILAVVITMCFGMSLKASAQACAPPWQVGMSVSVGQMVSFPVNGVTHNFTAIQQEIQAAPNWIPPAVQALWTDDGPCGGGPVCTVKPSAPTGLTSSSITQSGVSLSWTAPPTPAGCTITGYTVFENGASIGNTANTSLNVTGLASGASFNFTVAASDGAGLGSPSAQIQVTTLKGNCTVVPGAPTGLTPSLITASGVTLSWTAPSAPAGCTITGFTIFENGASINTTTNTSFAVTGLASGTSFNFTVAASDGAGTGAQSAQVVVMTLPGGGGTCFTPWDPGTMYHAGDQVSLKGINYHANFFSQNQSPDLNNGGPGTGQPWTNVGACSACTTLAAAPGTPSPSNITFNSAHLTWPAVTAPAHCTITGYTILKNGSPTGTATGTSFDAFGLAQDTTFNFSVEANDGAGSSAPSPAASVHTLKCTGTQCGGGKVTFAQYHDITVNADFNTGLQRTSVTGAVQPITNVMPNKTLVWAFATGTCDQESWAGISPAMEATNVQAFVNAGKNYIISTGGQNGPFDCSSGQGLINFINRYNSPNLVGIDYDIEGSQSQQLIDNLINATKAAQQQFPNLMFTFTIQSLGTTAANPITGGSVGGTVVREINRIGLSGNWAINLMTFDYGSTNPNNCVVVNNACDMGNSAIQAAQALNQQSGIPFNHIGITMMIGQADTKDEFTTLHDIDTISAFVTSNGLPVARFWAFERDTPGSGGCCSSGTNTPALAFTHEFMNSLNTQ